LFGQHTQFVVDPISSQPFPLVIPLVLLT